MKTDLKTKIKRMSWPPGEVWPTFSLLPLSGSLSSASAGRFSVKYLWKCEYLKVSATIAEVDFFMNLTKMMLFQKIWEFVA